VRQFERRTVRKVYRALVSGVVAPDSGVIEKPIGPDPRRPQAQTVRSEGRPAVTEFKVLTRFRRASYLELEPRTGRTHQIRVHMASIGHPLLVDPLYAESSALHLSSFKPGYKIREGERERPLLDRTPLHASRLEFAHPDDGHAMVLESPMPHDIEITLKKLERWG
jgi:RluA family pseudouridine synthase